MRNFAQFISTEPRLQRLAALARGAASPDPAHDFSHCLRVGQNALTLGAAEGGDPLVLAAAALLHDIENLPKDHPESKFSSERSSERARRILAKEGFGAEQIEAAADAILCHSFSRGLTPRTKDGRIFQDADRLDAIGAVGIARAYAVGGALGRPLYWHEDPLCTEGRTPCDKPSKDPTQAALSRTANTLDHFSLKLLKLEETMQTAAGRLMARERTEYLRGFIAQLGREIGLAGQ